MPLGTLLTVSRSTSNRQSGPHEPPASLCTSICQPPPHLGTGQAHPQDATESKCQTPPSGQQCPSMCPPGSVMMRRVLFEDLVRAGTLENYFRKEPLKGGGGEPAAKTTT